MQLVDVHLSADQPIDLVLHPRLSVITGEDADIERLRNGLTHAFVLAGTEIFGTVDYSGFQTALDQTGVVSLDLPGEGMRLVTSGDLPAPDNSQYDTQLAGLADRRSNWNARRDEAAAELDRLKKRLAATESAISAVTEDLEATEAARGTDSEAWGETRERMEAAEADVRAIAANVEALNTSYSEAAVLRESVEELFDDAEAIRAIRLGDSVESRSSLVAQIRELDVVPEQHLMVVAQWLDDVQKGKAAPDPVVANLLNEVGELQEQWDELSRVSLEDEPTVKEARDRYQELHERLETLEGLSQSGVLADRARSEIDNAHSERTAAEEGRSRASTVEAAVAHEHDVAGQYGFDSYLDYTIASSTRSVGDAVENTLESIRGEAMLAKNRLENERAQGAERRHQVAEIRERARNRVEMELGASPETLTVEDLRRVPAIPDEVSELLAKFDASVQAQTETKKDLEGRSDATVAELAMLAAQLETQTESQAASATKLEELAPLLERVEEERSSVDQRILGVQQRVSEAEQGLATCDSEMADLQEYDTEGYGASDISVVVSHLTPMIDPPGPDPVPVVIDDALSPLADHSVIALEALMVASLRVQVIYFTQDRRLLKWADAAEPSAASVIRLARPGWLKRTFSGQKRSSKS